MWNFLFSGSVCPGNGTEETREESKVVGECQFVDISESECDDDLRVSQGVVGRVSSMPTTHFIFQHLFAESPNSFAQ